MRESACLKAEGGTWGPPNGRAPTSRGTPRGTANRCDKMLTPVRIAIDARKLRDYGIGTYIRNLLRHLARIDDKNEYVVLCREDGRHLRPSSARTSRPVPQQSLQYSVREQVALPLELRREKAPICSTRRTTCCRR